MNIVELDALREAWEQSPKVLRFGQYVINMARAEFPEPVPHIFYETDPDKAFALLLAFSPS